MEFQLISLNQYCPTISYQFKVKHLRETHLVDILIIKFNGKYRDGSAGDPDAGFIKGIITTGISVSDPFKLLIDFTDFGYRWGDYLDLSFGETGHTRTAVLVGEHCRRAFSTLAFGIDTKEDIVDENMFFDDFNKALKKLQEKDS